jgi:hypothetical protein
MRQSNAMAERWRQFTTGFAGCCLGASEKIPGPPTSWTQLPNFVPTMTFTHGGHIFISPILVKNKKLSKNIKQKKHYSSKHQKKEGTLCSLKKLNFLLKKNVNSERMFCSTHV